MVYSQALPHNTCTFNVREYFREIFCFCSFAIYHQRATHGGRFIPNGAHCRWEGPVKFGIVMSLGVGLIISEEKIKPPPGGCGVAREANKPSSNVSDRVKVRNYCRV